MKKRKTYEISVIDKTYSNTISDETKFYTSDTALELGFELKETEYDFESAEIVLLNIDDRSLVTRSVSKVEDGFTYELDDDITAHYGEWRGQLRFEQAGEIYVSSPVKFRIENDLSNERPPQLSDVQSWVSLKRYADDLADELKQAVLSIEGVEDTFNANETVRQSRFSNAEQSRQDTFETNESERDETFNTNEDIRKTQELEREKAEATRQSVFEDNESSRTETFNTNEVTRQENESARQQAETQRATAESSRVSAETQRKIDHANRSAELSGKADKAVLNNLVIDGDKHVTVQSSYNNQNHTHNTSKGIIDGHIYYLSLNARKIDDTHKALYFGWSHENFIYNNNRILIAGSGLSESGENRTFIFKGVSGRYLQNILFSGFSGNMAHADVWDVQILDLTETFGAGNEPTKDEIDELIKVTGYIDGEYALNNKEMLIWTIALIRRNKNAIVALGGA